MTWTVITPGPGVSDLDLNGACWGAGNDGTLTILDADDFDDAGQTAGYVLALNATNDGVVSVARKVGNWWPTSFTSLSNASRANTIGQVTVASQPWDWRPACQGQGLVSMTGRIVGRFVCQGRQRHDGDIAAAGSALLVRARVPALSAGALRLHCDVREGVVGWRGDHIFSG